MQILGALGIEGDPSRGTITHWALVCASDFWTLPYQASARSWPALDCLDEAVIHLGLQVPDS